MIKKEKRLIECPLCSFTSKRLTNFEKHLNETHDTTTKKLWDERNSGPKLCLCGCGQETTFVNWWGGYNLARNGHASNLEAFHGPEKAAKIKAQRNAALKGAIPWSKGKTKETDERLKKLGDSTSAGRLEAFKEGRITLWSKGKTKDTDERLKKAAEQASNDFQSGARISWHKGKTEESDLRIKAKNDALRQRYASGELVAWHKGKTKEDDPRIAKTWQSRDPVKEYEHIRFTVTELKEKLSKNQWLELVSADEYRNWLQPGLVVRCKYCDFVAKVSLQFALGDRCKVCNPIGSNGQLEIAAFIKDLGFHVATNVRGILGRQELDIFVPEKKLAFEFNGLHWHNVAAGKDESYHQNKSDRCEGLGISLMHIFEDEWLQKKEIVKSMIQHKLNHTKERFFARKCKVVKLTVVDRHTFFEENHIDGDINASFTLGLTIDDQLVSAMSIRRPFHNKHRESLEVARFCCKKNMTVTGALGRLTKACLSQAKQLNARSLISYVDARFGGTRDSWTKSGWIFDHETTPRFWWTDSHKRFNRFQFRANKKQGLTEEEVALANNVVRIYCCKNVCYRIMP